jgi:hypothetical protein
MDDTTWVTGVEVSPDLSNANALADSAIAVHFYLMLVYPLLATFLIQFSISLLSNII